MSEISCSLCGLPVRSPVTVDGTDAVFCCHGCSNVYQILVESGSYTPGGDPSTNPIFVQAKALGLLGNPSATIDASPTPEAKIEGEGGAVDDARQCVLRVDGMWCSSCAWLISHILLKRRGVAAAEVSFLSDTAKITYRPAKIGQDDLVAAIDSLGYHAHPMGEADVTDPRMRRRRSELIRTSFTFFFAMNVMMFQIVQYAGYRGQGVLWFLGALSAIVVGLSWPIFNRAYQAARHAHATMDTLVSLGALTAFAYSIQQLLTGSHHVYFDTACMLLGLVMVGKFLESGVRAKATDALTTLYGLLPRKASVLHDGVERPVAVEQLAVGDIFRVRPGERIAADGIVAAGSAGVDESLLTGESRPSPKAVGDPVTGGAIVLDGALDVSVTRIGPEGALAKMIALVEEAMRTKTPAEQWADRISRVFVPSIIALALATVAVMLLSGHTAAETMTRAVAVLVIACPCALGIATPMAMAAGVGAAASKGILIADGTAFELLCRLKVLVLDKTGTATEGQFAVREVSGEMAALDVLAALETRSEHPIGRAIVRHAAAAELPPVNGFEAVPGMGVAGIVDGQCWFAGSLRYADQQEAAISGDLLARAKQHESAGLTVIYWGRTGAPVAGFVALGDSIRAGAPELVSLLAARNVSVELLSGDARETVDAVAATLGVTRRLAGALPADKAAYVKQRRDELAGAGIVGMIGDGVNDAPALAIADLSIAMASGADVASRASQITLLNADLRRIPELLDLARQTTRIMHQNLFWACAYNAVCIPLAMFGVVQPIWAAVAMMVSSASVILNTRRLKWIVREG
ncbi:MAG TPA: heavy metal translocating P-type ATPase [Capsulimonadaceae bacterium]|jgi:heavy metal translocating P-type ATPase